MTPALHGSIGGERGKPFRCHFADPVSPMQMYPYSAATPPSGSAQGTPEVPLLDVDGPSVGGVASGLVRNRVQVFERLGGGAKGPKGPVVR